MGMWAVRALPDAFRAPREPHVGASVHPIPTRTYFPPERLAELALSDGWAGSRPYLQNPGILTVLSKRGFDPVALPARFTNITEMVMLMEALAIPRKDWPEALR